ncbi:DNA polymerase [Paenilisteria rocourtiae]|uniref:DNA polymerase I n=1 Tax=Listeria rocourtiae TaxID=647910 RepID=A0A4R6ZN66_9LIST|nr:DNA polymerase [Listeria rocourtiae]EUJ42557.1 DNA polymerase I-3'-5' exonuclease and polymerase domains [Listeria rocourtiae FSL F6-920]TDR53927.1 DNA polymerase-1 [Listeria rocourtiae]
MAPKVQLTLNLDATHTPTTTLTEAAKRKKASTETLEEAWQRLASLKNDATAQRMIAEVKAAMEAGKIGREASAVASNKRLSKAEVKRLWVQVKEIHKQEVLDDMVANMPDNYWLIQTVERLDEFLAILDGEQVLVFDVETTGVNVYRDYLVGHVISAVDADLHAYIPVRHITKEIQLDAEYVAQQLKPYYENGAIKKIAHNAGYDIAILKNDLGITLNGLYFDTMPAMTMLNENEPSYALKKLVKKYLNIPSLTYEELFGKNGFETVSDLRVATAYAAKDGDITLKLMRFQQKHFERFPSIYKYFMEVEMPFVETLVETEATGFVIDQVYAAEYAQKLGSEIEELREELTDELNGININSPAQLRPELEKLTGQRLESVDAKKVLKPLANKFPLIKKYLKFKFDTKLYGTYINKLPNLIEPKTGRLHPSYQANGAATGRLSSSGGFNAQNLPPEAREIIVAPENKVIVGLDFGNQEGRIAAAKVKEEFLLKAFREGRDPYIALASIAYDTPEHEISKDSKERKRAKTGFLAYIYGTGDRTMGEQLGITTKEAHELKATLGAQMPKLAQWTADNKTFVKRNGFVWIGDNARKRRLPDAMKGEYRPLLQCSNARVQGEAAIQTKVTMNKMSQVLAELRAKGRDFHPLATVHDELLVEAPADITEAERDLLVEVMTQSYLLEGVDNESDVEIYMERWGDAVRWDEFVKERGGIID